ncbi:hypothetical protein, partial [Mycobacterium marinum]
ICLVLAVGLVGMLVVRVPRHGGVVVTETT